MNLEVAVITMLSLLEAFKPSKLEIILENNLPKGTLKLHNTINSIAS